MNDVRIAAEAAIAFSTFGNRRIHRSPSRLAVSYDTVLCRVAR
jgi:hypothetical protein